MTLANSDLQWMQRAHTLAQKGIGLVSPNPLVGAVVVSRGEVVGEGFYRFEPQKHAEVIALEKAGARAKGSTLYLNLEPCSHYGRTPPCADLIIQSGVKKVVASIADPNPLVGGKGFAKLRQAGVAVEVGLLESEAKSMNEAFAKFVQTRTPFVILKSAITLDGKLATATGNSRWISGAEGRLFSHELRHASDAILVGIGTVLKDDPTLTDRTGRARWRPLLRLVLDARLQISLNAQLVRTAERDVMVFCSDEVPARRISNLEYRGVRVHALPLRDGHFDWKKILKALGDMEVASLVIEGGSEVNWSALRARIVDKIHVIVAPKILGGRNQIPFVGGPGIADLNHTIRVKNWHVQELGEDFLITGYLH